MKAYNTAAEDGERIVELSPNGRYAKLNCVLGKGAYKVVYKSIDREEGYEVAWNCFQTGRQEYAEMSHEIEILKRVRHPNIINFHDCWFNNGEFIFITELMTSGTLREYIKKLQTPSLKIVKRWCRQILKGLLYLHSHNPPIIHRDIKCDNIFINGAHGEVKIADLGSAKMKAGKMYTLLGTPEYIASEMYNDQGYNEKVDVYAFGMCCLEALTGQTPYSECTNTAQIYKKVMAGIKPESLKLVTDTEVLDLLNHCLDEEPKRWSVQQLLDHPFLTVEPEVVLLSANEQKNHLTLQVVFKGMDRLSVKFEFNVETDTAEEVVHEMIEENVLPQKYQALISHEINRILRDLSKLTTHDIQKVKDDSRVPWRRSDTIKDELDRAKQLVKAANDRATEAEKKAELSEVRARLAENKPSTSASAPQTQTMSGSVSMESVQDVKGLAITTAPPLTDDQPNSTAIPLKDYKDDQPIEDLVKDTILVNNRGADKEKEWLQRLHAQDIVTVGDLKDLHNEDWGSLGLTVFASRALRNALHGKLASVQPLQRSQTISPKNTTRSLVTTPPVPDQSS